MENENMPHTSQDNITGSLCPSIDEFRSQVYPTIYCIITIIGLLSNGFALIILIRTAHQCSAFHIYMLNLVVSDLLCVSTLPLRVIYYVKKGQWEYGDFLCRVSSYAFYVNLYCSILFMMVVSGTRFLAIVFPVQNLRLVSVHKACTVCICIWVFICLTSSPFLLSGTHVDPITNKTKCFEPPDTEQDITKLIILNYFSLVVGFAVPFLVILMCYAGIIHTLLFRPSIISKHNHTKTIRMIVIVMLAFLVSFMPYHILRTVHLHSISHQNCDEIVSMQKSVVVTLCLAASNSCFDPMLYFFSGANVRRQIFSRKSLQRSAKVISSNHLGKIT